MSKLWDIIDTNVLLKFAFTPLSRVLFKYTALYYKTYNAIIHNISLKGIYLSNKKCKRKAFTTKVFLFMSLAAM